MTLELKSAIERTRDYITNALDGSQRSTDVLLGRSYEEVVNSFAERVVGILHSAEFETTKDEVITLLEGSLKQRFDIVPKTIFVIEERAGT